MIIRNLSYDSHYSLGNETDSGLTEVNLSILEQLAWLLFGTVRGVLEIVGPV
jgi:hypothetical protein